MNFNVPSLNYILKIHEKMLQRYNSLGGIRDSNALNSALSTAYTGFSNGVEVYPDTIDKICITSFKLITNHPFVDGNKRVGTYALLSLLKVYNFEFSFSKEALEELIIGVAEGSIFFEEFKYWINSHVEKISDV